MSTLDFVQRETKGSPQVACTIHCSLCMFLKSIRPFHSLSLPLLVPQARRKQSPCPSTRWCLVLAFAVWFLADLLYLSLPSPPPAPVHDPHVSALAFQRRGAEGSGGRGAVVRGPMERALGSCRCRHHTHSRPRGGQ